MAINQRDLPSRPVWEHTDKRPRYPTTDPLRRIVEDRVEILLRYRHWYRAHPQVKLGGLERIHTAELRALVRLLRAARLQEKADTVWHAPEQADPVTAGKAYHDWQAGA